MTTETINGLHKCQPKNEPQQGEVKNMVVEHKRPRDGKKAWIKIKNELPEKGGSPYRILNVEKLPWEPDNYGNVSFNLEIEASSSAPSAFQQTKAAMAIYSNDDDTTRVYDKGQHFHYPPDDRYDTPEKADAMLGQDVREHPATFHNRLYALNKARMESWLPVNI